MTTTILTCTCKHKFQDEQYGFFKRVFNKCCKVGETKWSWRCTVCGKLKDN